jgi:DNA-binding LacI/PurR family transcriptional regulator
MALPHYDMGHWAVEYLLEHSERGDDGQPPQHRLTCPYIERASVAQPPIR